MNRKTVAMVLGLMAVLVLVVAAPAFASPGQASGIGLRWLGVGGPRSAVNDASEILDMTPEEILEAKQDGKTLAEVAAEQGITVEELVGLIVSERTLQIEALVAEGEITREVADRALANLNEQITLAVERESLGYCLTGEPLGNGGGRGSSGAQARQGQAKGSGMGARGTRGAQMRGGATK